MKFELRLNLVEVEKNNKRIKIGNKKWKIKRKKKKEKEKKSHPQPAPKLYMPNSPALTQHQLVGPLGQPPTVLALS